MASHRTSPIQDFNDHTIRLFLLELLRRLDLPRVALAPARQSTQAHWRNPRRSRSRTRSRNSPGPTTWTCGIQERIQRVNSLRLELANQSSTPPSRRARIRYWACHTRSRIYVATSLLKIRRTRHGLSAWLIPKASFRPAAA